MILHLNIVGILLIALALIHAALPRYFQWREEVRPLSLITRQIFYVHTFFIAFMVLLMGILCLTCTTDLLNTALGRVICIGLLIFWGVRMVFQLFVYSPRVWRGKRFETAMHILFCCLWIYINTIFFLAIQSNNS